MALFKIFKGLAANLSSQPKKEGQVWLTTDDNKLYVDTSDSTRSPINAYAADVIKNDEVSLTASDIASGMMPSGGTSGQVLTKTTGGAAWANNEVDCPIVRLFSETLSAGTNFFTIDLSGVDMSQYQELDLTIGDLCGTLSSDVVLKLTFNADGSNSYRSGYGSDTYAYINIATLRSGYKGRCRVNLMSGVSRTMTRAEHCYTASDFLYDTTERNGVWYGGGIADLKIIRLSCESGQIAAGTSVVLYGRKK